MPPSVGPSAGPITFPIPHQPTALPLSSLGKVSLNIASEVGAIAPPPMACTILASTRKVRLFCQAAKQRACYKHNDAAHIQLIITNAIFQPVCKRNEQAVRDHVNSYHQGNGIQFNIELFLNNRKETFTILLSIAAIEVPIMSVTNTSDLLGTIGGSCLSAKIFRKKGICIAHHLLIWSNLNVMVIHPQL